MMTSIAMDAMVMSLIGSMNAQYAEQPNDIMVTTAATV
jgi:hypothetical protein